MLPWTRCARRNAAAFAVAVLLGASCSDGAGPRALDGGADGAVDGAAVTNACLDVLNQLVAAEVPVNATIQCTSGAANPASGVFPCCGELVCETTFRFGPLCVARRGARCEPDGNALPVCAGNDECDPVSSTCRELTCSPTDRDCAVLDLACCAPGAVCEPQGGSGAHRCCLPDGEYLSDQGPSLGTTCCSNRVAEEAGRKRCVP